MIGSELSGLVGALSVAVLLTVAAAAAQLVAPLVVEAALDEEPAAEPLVERELQRVVACSCRPGRWSITFRAGEPGRDVEQRVASVRPVTPFTKSRVSTVTLVGTVNCPSRATLMVVNSLAVFFRT